MDGQPYCIEIWDKKEHGVIYFFCVNLLCFHLAPIVIICLSNLKLWWHVRQRQVPIGLANWQDVQKAFLHTQRGVRNILSMVTLMFVICWIPLYAIGIKIKLAVEVDEKDEEIIHVALPLAQLLGSWNSCVNPVFYAFVNSKFREMVFALLPSWCPFKCKSNQRQHFGLPNVHREAEENNCPDSYDQRKKSFDCTLLLVPNEPVSFYVHHQRQLDINRERSVKLGPESFKTLVSLSSCSKASKREQAVVKVRAQLFTLPVQHFTCTKV